MSGFCNEWGVEGSALAGVPQLRTIGANDRTTVSVVVPVFNCGRTLPHVLAALAAQTVPPSDIEVVLGDDGGDDDYGGLLSREWPWPLTVERHRRNGFRLSTIRNRAASACQHDVLLFLDGDCVPEAGLISEHVSWHQRFVNAVVFGPRRFIALPPVVDDEPTVMFDALRAAPRILSDANFGIPVDRRTKEVSRFPTHPFAFHLAHGCNMSVSRAGWREAGGFSSEFDGAWGYEDTEFAYRLALAGAVFIAEPRALVYHLDAPEAGSRTRAQEEVRNFALVSKLIPGFAEFKDHLRSTRREPWW